MQAHAEWQQCKKGVPGKDAKSKAEGWAELQEKLMG